MIFGFIQNCHLKIGGSKELFSDNEMIRILQLFHQYYCVYINWNS